MATDKEKSNHRSMISKRRLLGSAVIRINIKVDEFTGSFDEKITQFVLKYEPLLNGEKMVETNILALLRKREKEKEKLNK